MRILVVRSGSGWGGTVDRYIIDTTEKVYINLIKCFRITNDTVFLETGAIELNLNTFPKETISEYNYNLDLLECFLSDCELHVENYTMFDQQIDYIYVLTEMNEIRCVYNTNIGIWPKNPALLGKIKSLLGEWNPI